MAEEKVRVDEDTGEVIDESNDDDFGVYGKENDENKSHDVEGITGTVTSYDYTTLDFPAYVIKFNGRINNVVLNSILSIYKSSVSYLERLTLEGNMNEEEKDLVVYVYFLTEKDGKEVLYKLGPILRYNLTQFLDLVGVDNITGYISKDEVINGSLLYALARVD